MSPPGFSCTDMTAVAMPRPFLASSATIATALAAAAAVLALGIDALAPVGALAQAQRPEGLEAFERCRTITDNAARLRCFESATAGQTQPRSATGATAPGPWRLVRTPHPQGGRDAVSTIRTADLTRSDVNFAGVMLRCAERGVEVLVVLVEPLPPQTRPELTIVSGGKSTTLSGSVLPPGALVLLPAIAIDLVTGPWQAAGDISIEINEVQKPVRGAVSLSGLSAALAELMASCPLR